MTDMFSEEKSICSHFGDDYERFCGAVVPPIFENSLFIFEKYEDILESFKAERDHYLYTRGTNPTVEILEKKLAALEHGESCKCFSSGMAAISSALITFVKHGDHILFVNNIYGPALKYANYIKKFGIEHSVTLKTDIETIEKEVKDNTRVIYLESPATMTFKMLDLKAIADFAKSRGIVTIIDNTWATPIFQKPLDFGIDVSIHSCTKYIGGHSDVVAGAVISSREIMDQIFYNEYQLHGGNIGPFEAWLLMRGLRTLPLRMEKYQENGFKVAHFLEGHKNVKKVNYPVLESSPDYELGRKQLKGYSALMSFELKSEDFEDVKKVINTCRIFKIGVSWGGHESLILSPNHGDNEEELRKAGISTGLIRISVGLEGIEDIIDDLNNALNALE
jgi:cystathionine beta-lyase